MNKFLVLFVCLAIGVAAAAPPSSSSSHSNIGFTTEIYDLFTKDHANDNIVFSPASIQSCMGLAYLGADGNTAEEIKKAFHFNGESKEAVGESFRPIMETRSNNEVAFNIVNRVYIDEKYDISPKFNELASKYFQATAEKVNFANSAKAAGTINSWVEENTAHKIKDLVPADGVDASTSAVLVNAIHFKGEWRKVFETSQTTEKDFFLDETKTTKVSMMKRESDFHYADLPELNAVAIDLPYVSTQLKMRIIMPKDVTGLAELEEKLKNSKGLKISEKMQWGGVLLEMPKFKIQFETSLLDVFQKLGVKDAFSPAADFSSLLAHKEPFLISEAKHKAFIEVTEAGTEAAAATYVASSRMGKLRNYKPYHFLVNHPFIFSIQEGDTIFFAGHVVHFD